jgi:hypothetical protein
MRLACLKAMASTTGRKREPVTKTGSRRLAAPPPDAANQSVLACEGGPRPWPAQNLGRKWPTMLNLKSC